MNYLDFDLQIEAIGAGNHYRARVLTSPAGQAECHFTLPFDEKDLRIFVLSVGRTRSGVRSLNSPQMREATEFGSDLYRAVFQDQVQGCLLRSLDEADKQGAGLRLRLRLDGRLINLPWEFLYDTTHRRFFSHSNRTPIVRFLDVPQRIPVLAVALPLKVLVMIASPSDYAPLDVEREWQKVKDAVKTLEATGLLQLTRLENGTFSALRRRLLTEQFHVFHYIGHGSYDDENEEGVLLLEDENGRGRRVSGTHLGTLLHDHTALRLVLLNACEGARSAVTDLFAGVAQHLVLQGLPAVIAMQFEITDHAAITLAQAFYEALGTGSSVDAALAEARKAIFAEGNDVEWATPVLYMRATDGRLFDLPKLLQKPEPEKQSEGEKGEKGAGVSQPIPTPKAAIQQPKHWLPYTIGSIAVLIMSWFWVQYLRGDNNPTATPTPASVAVVSTNTPIAPVDTDTPTAVATNATLTPTLPAAVIVATATPTVPTATATVPTATFTATEQPTETPTVTPSVTPTTTPTVPKATATVPTATFTATEQPTETPTLTPSLTPTDTPILPTATATATLLAGMPRNATAGQAWTEPFSKIDFVHVPAGEFLMGSTPQQVKDADELCKKYYPGCNVDWFTNELTQTTISTAAYWIGKTEITNAQFKRFIDDKGYSTDAYWTVAGLKWRKDNKVTQPDCWENKDLNSDSQPVVCVSWYEALAYTNWLSQTTRLTVRLPSEAEWEKAARGTKGQIYPWGNDFDGARLNYCDSNCAYPWKDKTVNDGYANTAPVGSFPSGASPYGALDMAGNVWEWTSSQYIAYPYKIEDGREDETVAAARRVLRGGSWYLFPLFVRTALRFDLAPDGRHDIGGDVGFRVVLSAPQ